jgi:hypothetical protein
LIWRERALCPLFSFCGPHVSGDETQTAPQFAGLFVDQSL